MNLYTVKSNVKGKIREIVIFLMKLQHYGTFLKYILLPTLVPDWADKIPTSHRFISLTAFTSIFAY